MNYGKNQQALLDFLHKHPNQWHRIKRRKAIDAARSLERRNEIAYLDSKIKGQAVICLPIPQMLMEQN